MNKETIELVKKMVEDGNLPQEVAIKYCPELEKDKDEKIRKALLIHLKNELKQHGNLGLDYGIITTDAIAWLEKKGGQKAIKVPKFKVGDWIIHNTNPDLIYYVESILSPQSECYCLEHNGGTRLMNFSEDNDYHLWAIQDAKDGDVLVSNDASFIVLFKGLSYLEDDIDRFKSYCHYREGIFSPIEDPCWCCNAFHPATKEQRNLLFQKMKEAGYEWDSEKKELRKIEDVSTWKPSKEQIEALEKATHIIGSKYKSCLASLYQDLKKLIG